MLKSSRFISIFLVSAIASSLSSCFSLTDESVPTLLSEMPNYKGDKKAILMLKEPALSLSSYQVSVCDRNHKLEGGEVGNTFTVDPGHDGTNLDSTSICFAWISNDTLQIDYDSRLRTFIQLTKVDGVTVIYKPR